MDLFLFAGLDPQTRLPETSPFPETLMKMRDLVRDLVLSFQACTCLLRAPSALEEGHNISMYAISSHDPKPV